MLRKENAHTLKATNGISESKKHAAKATTVAGRETTEAWRNDAGPHSLARQKKKKLWNRQIDEQNDIAITRYHSPKKGEKTASKECRHAQKKGVKCHNSTQGCAERRKMPRKKVLACAINASNNTIKRLHR